MKLTRMQGRIIALVMAIAMCALLLCACKETPTYQPTSTLSAHFDNSHKVTENDTLDSIKPYFTVTYTNQNGNSQNIYDFSLSGTLAKGQRTITVTYNNLSCKVTITVVEEDVSVTDVILNSTSLTLNIGENQILSATIYPSNATNKAITWRSSDSSVASVNNGNVMAMGNGTATITATSSNGVSATCLVTVKTEVSSINIDNTSLSLNVGESRMLVATITPSSASDKTIVWSSSNTSVVSVNNGLIKALSNGSAIITATSSNGKSATCYITVKTDVNNVTLDSTSLSLKVGEKQTLSATVSPSTASDKSITWSSSDLSVVSVNNGIVSAVGSGTATITAMSSNGISATCSVSVWKPYTDMKISASFLRINVGETHTFTYIFTPSGASEKVTLKTQNTDLIEIGEHGIITAKAVGETTVWLESQSGLRSECSVQIVDIQGIDDMTLSSRDTSAFRFRATAKLTNISFVFENNTNASTSLQFIKYRITLTKTSSAENDPAASKTFDIEYKIYDSNNVIVKSGSLVSPSFCVGETVIMSGSINIGWNSSRTIGEYRVVLSGLS